MKSDSDYPGNATGQASSAQILTLPDVPDLNQARDFLNLLDAAAPDFTYQTFDDDQERKNGGFAIIRHGALETHASELTRANKVGCGIFVTINETDGKGRKGENIIRVRAFWVDLDGAPLDPVKAAPLPPHFLVESGGAARWHAYWLVEDCPLDQFRPVQKALAERFNSDPTVCDLPRVMRLPGFYHRKAEPRMVRLIRGTDAPPYQFAAFAEAFGIDLDQPPAALQLPPVHRTPSAPVLDAPATGAGTLVKARKIALDAALRTHQNQGISRHGEIYKIGQYMRRDGIPFTDETVRAVLETFEANMRPTDTSGKVCGLNWETETKTLLAPPSEPHRPGTHHADRPDFSALVDGARPAPVSGISIEAAAAIPPDAGRDDGEAKPFPLDEGEAIELAAWLLRTGKTHQRRDGWPRYSLTAKGNYTAPFPGIAARCGGLAAFLPAVEAYLPNRAKRRDEENARMVEAGKPPQRDIAPEAIRAKAREFLETVEALAVPDKRGRELLRKLDRDGKEGRAYTLLDFHALDALPAPRWRIKPILPAIGTASIYGPSGSGKTFLALDLALAIAASRDWFGFRVRAAPVVYVALEGEHGIQTRVRAYRGHAGDDGLENVRFLVEAFNLLSDDDRPALVEAIQAVGFESPVIILDTLNRATPGTNENDSADMGRIIAATKEIQAELGGLVVLVHHTGKDSGKGLRGHSSLHAALDAAIEVKREETTDARSWKVSKSKEGKDGDEYPFALKPWELGNDEDGDPVTSCVIEHGEGTSRPAPKAKPLTGDTRKALEILVEAIQAHGVAPYAGMFPSEIAHPPARYITSELWREHFYDFAKPSDKPATKQKAFTRASRALHELRAFSGWRDYVWLTPSDADQSALEVIDATQILTPTKAK